MSKRKLFLLSFVLTTIVWLVVHYVQRPRELPLVRVADGLFITA
ncbi:MAG: hypothetical protein P4L99_20050 [Chthoniobacter sp.]|nr:hypothetical protein [Chthoniobacter sp.]